MIKGSVSGKGYIHRVSGAVGAICRHSNVRCVIPSLELPGTYLKMSSIAWPPVVRKLYRFSFFFLFLLDDNEEKETYLLPPTSIHVGFVSHSSPSVFALPPNKIFGKGCWGRVAPAGSDGPGIRWIGRDEERRSAKSVARVFVGWLGKRGLEVELKRFWRFKSAYVSNPENDYPYNLFIIFTFYRKC